MRAEQIHQPAEAIPALVERPIAERQQLPELGQTLGWQLTGKRRAGRLPDLAATLGMPKEKVRLVSPFIGGEAVKGPAAKMLAQATPGPSNREQAIPATTPNSTLPSKCS